MKKRFGKRLMSVLLCFSLLLTTSLCVCVPVSAANGRELQELESNDSHGSANFLDDDITMYGVVSSGDVDYFKIGFSTDLMINIQIASAYSGLQIALENGTERLVSAQTELMCEEDTYFYGAELAWNAKAGTYYIELKNPVPTYSNRYLFYIYLTVGPHIHTYKMSSVVKPTCTARGYTVYSCECGDCYYDDYTKMAEHSFSSRFDLECNVCGAPRINGWKLENNRWVLYRNGQRQTSTWARDGAGWRYLDAEGYMLCNGWASDSHGWCYMNAEGLMVKDGWVKHNGDWYFMLGDGYMATDFWKQDSVDWCYLGFDGRMVTNGWAEDFDGWYFMDGNGHLLRNAWKKHGGSWYFLKWDGRMATNVWSKDSVGWCYLQGDGRMATNKWAKDSVGWCYVGEDGYCVTNCFRSDSRGWCYLDAGGHMSYNRWAKDEYGWYYIGSRGYIIGNSWVKDSIGWCYVGEDCLMVTDGWARDSHGWCYLDKTGHVAPHPNDDCDHNFTEATYFVPATCCLCGTKTGTVRSINFFTEDPDGFCTLYQDYTLAEVTVKSAVNNESKKVVITFDIQKIAQYRDGANGRVGASFVLYDYQGNEIDRYNFTCDGLAMGETVYNQTVTLDISSWVGSGMMLLEIEDIS